MENQTKEIKLPEDFETPREYVLANSPNALCSEHTLYWPGQGEKRCWIIILHPALSFSFSQGDTEDQAWERAAYRMCFKYMKGEIIALRADRDRLREALREIFDELDWRWDRGPDSQTIWMGDYVDKARAVIAQSEVAEKEQS